MRIDVVCPALRLPGQQHPESKNPAVAGFFKKLKLTDKAASFNHTSGIAALELLRVAECIPLRVTDKVS
ncbi:hypothetical protein O8H67_003186 [Enterobacter asburiae]|nr:hypothetical protein [Enterobacter asburiae]